MRFTFLHLFCSAQLSMSDMEKHYRSKIIIITVIKKDQLQLLHSRQSKRYIITRLNQVNSVQSTELSTSVYSHHKKLGEHVHKLYITKKIQNYYSKTCESTMWVKKCGQCSSLKLKLLRGTHIMFCNLDELMTSLLYFLYHIMDQFRDKKYYLIPSKHFHSMRQNVRQG